MNCNVIPTVEVGVRNEENGYPVPDPNKIMINITKEPSDAHQKTPQRANLGKNH
jgi:hypothetical protein